jgi:hypothetical protein
VKFLAPDRQPCGSRRMDRADVASNSLVTHVDVPIALESSTGLLSKFDTSVVEERGILDRICKAPTHKDTFLWCFNTVQVT